jgi:hypothetical protein
MGAVLWVRDHRRSRWHVAESRAASAACDPKDSHRYQWHYQAQRTPQPDYQCPVCRESLAPKGA